VLKSVIWVRMIVVVDLKSFERPNCDCNGMVAIVINPYNEGRARCLECGDETGLIFATDPPADTLR